MNTALFIIISATLLATVEVLKRKSFVSNSLSRRLAHIGAGVINLLAPLYVTYTTIIIVNVLFAGLLLVGRKTPTHQTHLSLIHISEPTRPY